jgi:signal transduction histidine kinase
MKTWRPVTSEEVSTMMKMMMMERETDAPGATRGAAFATQEREMAAAAYTLHDETVHSLACAQAELEIALSATGVEQGLRDSISSAAGHLDKALKSVHDTCCSLHPPVIDSLGLEAALRGLVKQMNAAYRIDYKLVSVGRESDAPDEVKLNLYRIAQEALRNTAEHSGAREVLVFLNRSYCGIDLVISDDGSGLPARVEESGKGFASMRERVESMGGTFACRSDHRGVNVKVHVPLAR